MKDLNIFNFLTNKLEKFTPQDSNDVKIYACGPTVYDLPHLGHARNYIFVDCLRRILQHYLCYTVRFVMNVTDLDDKIIAKGGILKIARHYEREFFETMDMLNVQRPDFVARVTDNMEIIKDFVFNGLNDFTYFRESSDLHFKSKKYLQENGRVFPDLNVDLKVDLCTQQQERDPRDFVLWKSKFWIDTDDKTKESMPGWHSECAAIAANEFGNYIDLHVGGIDLKFPHHENEIALGRVHFGKPRWVQYCLYTGHLEINGKKMSKSLKNFTTVDQVLVDGFSPLAIRLMFMQHKYSNIMQFSEDALSYAQKSYDLLMYHIESIRQKLLVQNSMATQSINQDLDKAELEELHKVQRKMDKYILDNLNMPKALNTMEKFIQRLSVNKENGMSHQALKYSFQYVLWVMDQCFGLMKSPNVEKKLEGQLLQLTKKFRMDVRNYAIELVRGEMKNGETLLKMCDDVRKGMTEIGYIVEDNKICKEKLVEDKRF